MPAHSHPQPDSQPVTDPQPPRQRTSDGRSYVAAALLAGVVLDAARSYRRARSHPTRLIRHSRRATISTVITTPVVYLVATKTSPRAAQDPKHPLHLTVNPTYNKLRVAGIAASALVTYIALNASTSPTRYRAATLVALRAAATTPAVACGLFQLYPLPPLRTLLNLDDLAHLPDPDDNQAESSTTPSPVDDVAEPLPGRQ
jgi:hypothetical protein